MTIPNSVTSIKIAAFENCYSLSSLEIPNSVTNIGGWVFSWCNMSSIVIPNSVISIGEMAFNNCHSLTSVVISNSVTSIGKAAFQDCDNLTTVRVDIDEPLTIDANTFTNRTNATLYIPYGKKSAYKNANYWKNFKTIIEMPGVGSEFTAAVPCNSSTANLTFKVTSIRPLEVEVMSSPENIAGALTIPATVKDEIGQEYAVRRIGNNAFENRSDLESVSLPEGLQTIGESSFRGSGLTSIKFPTSLSSVEHEAFCECASLKSIDFNGCSAYFEYHSFLGCRALEEVYIPNTIEFRNSDWAWSWGTFGYCTSLKKVVFEASEEGQSRYGTTSMFADCTALETVVLPSLNFVEHQFFINCEKLKSITILKVEEDFDTRHNNFEKIFGDSKAKQIHFIVPDGTAETMLKAGYFYISDPSGLPLVRHEFEDEATRITAMADVLTNGNKEALNTAIGEARTIVNAAKDYAAIYAQITAIKTAAKMFLTTATYVNDLDVTAAYIINPDLERLQTGWCIEGDYNVWPNVNKRGWNESSYENGGVAISKFIEEWENKVLQNGAITQTITALPAGIYRLEADLIATWQEDASVKVTGVNLFAGSAKTAVATENEKPQHFSVKFENPVTKDVNIGVSYTNTNANFIAMDNVRLYYEGAVAAAPNGTELVSSEEDTYYIYNVETGMYLNGGNGWGTQAVLAETGLPVRMTQDEDGYWQIYFREGSRHQQLLFEYIGNEWPHEGSIFTDYDNNGCYQWIITDFDGSYIIQSGDDANTNSLLGNDPTRQDVDLREKKTLDTHVDVIRTDNSTSNIHWQFIQKDNYDLYMAKRYLLSTIFRMEQSGINNNDLLNNAKAVYDNDEATITKVIETTTLLNSQMGMPKANEPVDMTALITNPRFENNTSDGWTGAKLTQGGNAQNTQHQTHEFFQTSFNMFQTITGVPNGLYRLKWKGFHRPGNLEQVCNDYTSGVNNASAVVYANEVQKTMEHIYTGASDTQLNGSDILSGGKYIPNTQEGARSHFDQGYYADQLEVEVTDNVLTIGVKNTQEMGDSHWVIFSDFELEILENAEQMYNKLTAEDVKCVPGCLTTFNVNLTNRDNITGFQFDVELPEGATIYEEDGQMETQLTTRSNGHMYQCVKTGENTYQFSALSLASKSFKKNDGPIVRMTLITDASMRPGDYTVKVKDTELSKPNGMQVLPFDFTSTLTIKEADPGDVNGDGKITVTDAVYVFKKVNGETPEYFQAKAADLNGDKRITINDAVIIVNMILGNGQTMSTREAKKLLKRLSREY